MTFLVFLYTGENFIVDLALFHQGFVSWSLEVGFKAFWAVKKCNLWTAPSKGELNLCQLRKNTLLHSVLFYFTNNSLSSEE